MSSLSRSSSPAVSGRWGNQWGGSCFQHPHHDVAGHGFTYAVTVNLGIKEGLRGEIRDRTLLRKRKPNSFKLSKTPYRFTFIIIHLQYPHVLLESVENLYLQAGNQARRFLHSKSDSFSAFLRRCIRKHDASHYGHHQAGSPRSGGLL